MSQFISDCITLALVTTVVLMIIRMFLFHDDDE